MARAGLDKNRKFQRLAHGLNAILPGMAPALARGLLETLWSAAYERADDHLGDADDVEIAAGWTGARGMLANLLLVAGGETATGFIEADEDRGGYKVHAFWEHAPPWVKVKSDRAAARAATGKTISDIRRESGKASQFKPAANGQPVAGQTVNPLPESMRQKSTRDGTGRDGTGIKDIAEFRIGDSESAGGSPSFSLAADPPPCARGCGKPTHRGKCAKPKIAAEPMPFTIAEACNELRHGVIVDPFPTDRGVPKRMTDMIRAVPDVAEWRRIADWLADGGDGFNGGAREGKPSLVVFLKHFDDWRAKAADAAPKQPPTFTWTAEEIAAAEEKDRQWAIRETEALKGKADA